MRSRRESILGPEAVAGGGPVRHRPDEKSGGIAPWTDPFLGAQLDCQRQADHGRDDADLDAHGHRWTSSIHAHARNLAADPRCDRGPSRGPSRARRAQLRAGDSHGRRRRRASRRADQARADDRREGQYRRGQVALQKLAGAVGDIAEKPAAPAPAPIQQAMPAQDPDLWSGPAASQLFQTVACNRLRGRFRGPRPLRL